MDVQRLRDNFANVAAHGEEVALFFYSDLFLRDPSLRELFAVSMTQQRGRLLNALGRIVSQVDDLDGLVPFVRQLGRDHRKFGVQPDFYPTVGASLLATLAYFSGDDWTPELASDWTAAYTVIARVMTEAARDDEGENPPWWEGRVISHDIRRFDIAVIRLSLNHPMRYAPGQAVTVECAHRPRIWRPYSIANAPRSDGTVDLHVRLVDGGSVSTPLVRSLEVGDTLKLGAPFGRLTLDEDPPRDLLFVAGGTGLAPLKALLEQIAARSRRPRVHLFFGARTEDALYDLVDLEKLAAEHPWLTVTPSVSEEDDYRGERGILADVVARHGPWTDREAYVCGSPAMVEATVDRLRSLDIPENWIRWDELVDSYQR